MTKEELLDLDRQWGQLTVREKQSWGSAGTWLAMDPGLAAYLAAHGA
jgi:hypothetical protein